MSEHRYDKNIGSCVDPNPLKVERQDPDNFPRLQTRESCALEIAAYVFNKANLSDFLLDLNLFITNGIVSSKIYDKRGDFNFEIINFPFFDGDVPRSPSYGIYISQLIRFARVCSNVDDFNNRNLFLTA